ncbi:MAG: hypothetical protein L0271_10280 [Gemmatimonadetes bacterium]|nr:hypothetical protein [Gemmatimonadota bacterium]
MPSPGAVPGAENLPEGPILYHITVDGPRGTIVPVGEISGDSLRRIGSATDAAGYHETFIAEHLRQGAEFVLFHLGLRVGTLVVQSASVDASGCRPWPRATGILEMGAGAENVTEFLGLARLEAPQVTRRVADDLAPTRTMTVLAPIFADRVLRNRGMPLPANWQRAFAQIQPFPVAGARDAGFTATFLVGDTLGPGLDDAGQSVFMVAVPAQLGYDTVFVDVRDYAAAGKSAPAVLGFLDWDNDDSMELLLRVYGTGTTWTEAVGRGENGIWRRIFRDRCEPTPADSATAPPDTTG